MQEVRVVSLDAHKKFSKAVVLDWSGEVCEEARCSHVKREEMERFLARFQRGTDVIM